MTDRFEGAEVLVRATAPGRVELVDVHGDTWAFDVDREGVTGLPCTIVKDEMVAGILHVLIDTERPSVDGVRRFRVLRAMVP